MFIAAKFEEINPPGVGDYEYITDNAYTKEDILVMECQMLTTLNFQIVIPTIAHFMDPLQRMNGCDEPHKEFVSYLCELALLEIRMIKYTPSHLVSAAMLLSNEITGRMIPWPTPLQENTQHTEEVLRPCVQELQDLLNQAPYELSGPVGVSQYESEFYQKLKRKTTPIRTGSASGNRRNNPHPLESFLNWKLPPKPHAERYGSEWAGDLTDEILDAVCRGKIRSTYQQDFLGFPQGFQPQAPVKLPVDWKSKVGYSLDSSMRRCYQRPSQQYELKGNTSRYGCNKFKAVPAHGVVPTVSSRQMHLKNRTSYDMDYEGERSGRLHEARDLGRSHAMGALRNQTGVNSGPDFSAVPKLPDIPDCHL